MWVQFHPGDRRSDRGERNEFQISANIEEAHGFALQTYLKVFLRVHTQDNDGDDGDDDDDDDDDDDSDDGGDDNDDTQEALILMECWSRDEPRGLGPECSQGPLDIPGMCSLHHY